MTFEISKAVRKALPLLIMLYGKSGSGKTLTALKLALGLVEDGKRICLIDTENMRASYYSDLIDFDVINVESPHTPERYLEAFKLAESKYDVIIIDSFSLVWEGEGGCCDIAEKEGERLQANGKSGKGLSVWLKPKSRHKKLMHASLNSKSHRILSCRAKDKLKQVGSNIISDGEVPVCESDVPFQALIKFHLTEGGKTEIQSCVKEMLKDRLNIKGYLGSEHGRIIRDWVNEGEKFDTQMKDLKAEFISSANFGSETLQILHARIAKESPELLKRIWNTDFAEQVKNLAREADNLTVDLANEEEDNKEQEKLFKGVQ